MTGPSTTTFVHIRFLEPKNGSAAAPADVLFDSAGHAHHHSRKFGIVEHKKAHEDPETVPRLSVRAGETIVWIADTEFQVETIAPGNPFATLSLAVKSRRDESGSSMSSLPVL